MYRKVRVVSAFLVLVSHSQTPPQPEKLPEDTSKHGMRTKEDKNQRLREKHKARWPKHKRDNRLRVKRGTRPSGHPSCATLCTNHPSLFSSWAPHLYQLFCVDTQAFLSLFQVSKLLLPLPYTVLSLSPFTSHPLYNQTSFKRVFNIHCFHYFTSIRLLQFSARFFPLHP